MKTNQTIVTKSYGNALVSVRNEQVVTSSLQVAQVFDREHSKVLRAINNLDCSTSFKEANFGLSFYIREIEDRGQRKHPLYYMTRDGFTFLVMGFTGKIAAQFKEAYINAFNEMEKAISTGKEQEFIGNQVKKFCSDYTYGMKGIFKDCKDRFGFATCYGDMPVSLTWHDDWPLTKNLDYILPRLRCSLADGWYAAHQLIKTEKELSELRRTLSGVVGTLVHQHRIMP